jgi:hypothetical protein
MPRRRVTESAVGVVLAVVVVTGALTGALTAPALAQSDGDDEFDPLGTLLSDESKSDNDTDTEVVSAVWDRFTADPVKATTTAAGSIRASVSGWWAQVRYDPDARATASDRATDLQAYVNEYNESFLAYINARTNASTNYDVIRVNVTLNDETATKYLVADVNATTNDYEHLRMVNETNRTVDQWVTLHGIAADEAPADLEQFHEDYVATDTDLTDDPALAVELQEKYDGHVAGSFGPLPSTLEATDEE